MGRCCTATRPKTLSVSNGLREKRRAGSTRGNVDGRPGCRTRRVRSSLCLHLKDLQGCAKILLPDHLISRRHLPKKTGGRCARKCRNSRPGNGQKCHCATGYHTMPAARFLLPRFSLWHVPFCACRPGLKLQRRCSCCKVGSSKANTVLKK